MKSVSKDCCVSTDLSQTCVSCSEDIPKCSTKRVVMQTMPVNVSGNKCTAKANVLTHVLIGRMYQSY